MSACPSLGAYSGDGRLQVDTRKTRGGGIERKSGASAGACGASLLQIFCDGYPGNAAHAPLRVGGVSLNSSQIRTSSVRWSADTRTYFPAVSTQRISTSSIMVGGGSASTPRLWTEKPLSGTRSRSPDTTTLPSPSTGSMSTGTMPPETYASPLGPCRTATKGRVYDLRDAGPRNRFQAGPLIVHNCGGLLAGTAHVINLFEHDINADPYSSYAVERFAR